MNRPIRNIVLAAAAAAALQLAAAAAGTSLAPSPAAAQTAAAGEPMKLSKFRKKPVARASSRVVKRKDGSYSQVAAKRRAAKRKAARRTATELPVPPPRAETAAIAASTVGAGGAHALAAAPGDRVEVVLPDEINRIDLAAASAPAVEVVESGDVNAIDRAAAAQPAVSLDRLQEKLASAEARPGETPDGKPGDGSWFQHMLLLIGGAFAAASAAARALLA